MLQLFARAPSHSLFHGLNHLKYIHIVTGTLSISAFYYEKSHLSAEWSCTLDYIFIEEILEKLNFSLGDLKHIFCSIQNGEWSYFLFFFSKCISNIIHQELKQSISTKWKWNVFFIACRKSWENLHFLKKYLMLSHQYFVQINSSLRTCQLSHQNSLVSYFSLLKHLIQKECDIIFKCIWLYLLWAV